MIFVITADPALSPISAVAPFWNDEVGPRWIFSNESNPNRHDPSVPKALRLFPLPPQNGYHCDFSGDFLAIFCDFCSKACDVALCDLKTQRFFCDWIFWGDAEDMTIVLREWRPSKKVPKQWPPKVPQKSASESAGPKWGAEESAETSASEFLQGRTNHEVQTVNWNTGVFEAESRVWCSADPVSNPFFSENYPPNPEHFVFRSDKTIGAPAAPPILLVLWWGFQVVSWWFS